MSQNPESFVVIDFPLHAGLFWLIITTFLMLLSFLKKISLFAFQD